MNEPLPPRGLDLRWQWLILLGLIGALLYWLRPVLMPFAVAALFAYLFDPLVDRLERRLGRSLAVSLVFTLVTILLIAVVLVLVPFIEHQISNFLGQLPVWVGWLQTHALPWLQQRFGVTPELLDTQRIFDALQKHWKEAGGLAASVIGEVSRSGLALVGWILNLVMIPVVGFYLLRDWDVLIERINGLIPRAVEPVVSRLARESDQVLAAFLRGQLSVMLALGLFYGVALWLAGISVGPLIGMLAGLISFVPYLGAITGVLMGVVAALVQYQDWAHVLLVLGVFVVGQMLEGYVLVPRLVGDKIGLHPVAVIFAVLAGGELFGFLGILLALPVAAVVMVLLRYVHERYTGSALYHEGAADAVATAAAHAEGAAAAVPTAPAAAVAAPAADPPAAP
ncbi:MAG: AI-2E family transporter [Xanthomonadales bacterium]|nr:AI-2E family transporter [Xanthomonadales bacterium]MCC6595903.1 AI-2E family transporter [Rhodanobacteraceae bacterium]MDL1869577.1 AI-2E family transporter [Gammaproteobacteria bacterium PRO6]